MGIEILQENIAESLPVLLSRAVPLPIPTTQLAM